MSRNAVTRLALYCGRLRWWAAALCLAAQGCASHGVEMVANGKEAVTLPAGSKQLPTGDTDFFALSPMDSIQIYVLPKKAGDPNAQIDYGSQVRVTLKFAGGSYAIMPGDRLRVRFDAEPDKLVEAEVQPDGYITLPQVPGQIRAAGATPAHLAAIVTQLYGRIMIAPKITVAIEKSSIDQLLKVDGAYAVGRDGQLLLPMLGAFHAAGQAPAALAAAVSRTAGETFHNPITASVALVPLVGREADPRTDPDGQQYFRSTVKVGPDGSISVPLAGTVPAAGRTLGQLRSELVRRLQPAYKNPIDANLALVDSSTLNVFVGGQVRIPGRYPFVQSLTMLQAVTAAGWVDEWGDLGNAILMHRGADGRYVVYRANLDDAIGGRKLDNDLRLSPRDIVIVPRSGIAKVDLFIDQYIRKFLPFNLDAGYSYGQGSIQTRTVTQPP